MPDTTGRPYTRYVAIGDSSTEGLDDPDGQGGYHGWANRLAQRLADAQGEVEYANLGVRGRRTRQILEQQLAAALAMRPDLVTLFSGTNDMVAPGFDPQAVRRDVETMHRACIDAGAVVLGFTLPDLSDVLPFGSGRRLAPKIVALNAALRLAAANTGALLVDFAAHPVASDLRYWSDDRFHANARGHAMIAEALAHALGLPGASDGWAAPLGAHRRSRIGKLVADLRWVGGHFVPWLWRHAQGRSSGDGMLPKRPTLTPVQRRADSPSTAVLASASRRQ